VLAPGPVTSCRRTIGGSSNLLGHLFSVHPRLLLAGSSVPCGNQTRSFFTLKQNHLGTSKAGGRGREAEACGCAPNCPCTPLTRSLTCLYSVRGAPLGLIRYLRATPPITILIFHKQAKVRGLLGPFGCRVCVSVVSSPRFATPGFRQSLGMRSLHPLAQ
jgi:hypothetical protein